MLELQPLKRVIISSLCYPKETTRGCSREYWPWAEIKIEDDPRPGRGKTLRVGALATRRQITIESQSATTGRERSDVKEILFSDISIFVSQIKAKLGKEDVTIVGKKGVEREQAEGSPSRKRQRAKLYISTCGQVQRGERDQRGQEGRQE